MSKLIAASALALFTVAVSGFGQTPAEKPAAVVNGQAISYGEVENLLKHRPPSPTPLTDAQTRELRQMTLDMLVDNLVMQQYMRRTMPLVAPEELRKSVDELSAALKKQGKTIQDYCNDTGLTEAQLRDNIQNRLQRDVYVRTHLTEDEVKRYYLENKEYFDNVSVRVSHIVLRVAPSASPVERGVAREKLQQLRQQIESGQLDFAQAAKQYSQCPTAPEGGDIGYIQRKFVVDEAIARAAFATQVGHVSDVVQSDYGMHILRVTDRKQDGPASEFDKVRDQVRSMAAGEMLQNLLGALRKEGHIEIYMK